jgi:hypothetical protein
VLFSRFLTEGPIPRLLLQQRIFNEKSKNRRLLEEACKELRVTRAGPELVTGEIRNDDAARRYLRTAISLGLVKEISGRLYNTKRGEVLASLSKGTNPFRLSFAQKYLLFKTIIEKDYDYIRTVVVCALEDGSNEAQHFFKMLQDLWQQKLSKAQLRGPEAYDQLRKAMRFRRKSVESTKKYYFENIKALRLEWLLDLSAIDFWNQRKNRISYRDSLGLLLDSDESDFSSQFVFHMKPLLNISITYWQEVPVLQKTKILERFLQQSFSLFTASVTLQKISMNQYLEYGVSTLAESGIICEIEELASSFEDFIEGRLDSYRYVKIVSEADRGYISRL